MFGFHFVWTVSGSNRSKTVSAFVHSSLCPFSSRDAFRVNDYLTVMPPRAAGGLFVIDISLYIDRSQSHIHNIDNDMITLNINKTTTVE